MEVCVYLLIEYKGTSELPCIPVTDYLKLFISVDCDYCEVSHTLNFWMINLHYILMEGKGFVPTPKATKIPLFRFMHIHCCAKKLPGMIMIKFQMLFSSCASF